MPARSRIYQAIILALTASIQPSHAADPAEGYEERVPRTAEGIIPEPSRLIAETAPRPQPKDDNLRLGSLLAYPELVLSEVYDDNIFATRSNEESDLVTVLSPSVSLVSDWERHYFRARASGDFARYRSNDSENYNDYRTSMEGRYDLSRVANVFGGLGYGKEHEERASPEDVNGIEPTTYTSTSGHAGVYRKFNANALRLGVTADRLDFNDVPSSAGIINNDDRDRTESTAGARLSRQISPETELFVQGVFDRRAYADAFDDRGYKRDSDGYRAALGVKRKFGPRLEAQAFVGPMRQDYDDPRLEDVSTLDFGGRVDWHPSARTSVSATVDRSLEETTVYDAATGTPASSYVYSRAGVLAQHRLRPGTTLRAHLSVGRTDYQGIDRVDDLLVGGVGAQYRLTRNLYLEADYRFINRDSDEPLSDYFRNQIYVRLRGLLYPVREPRVLQRTTLYDLPAPEPDALRGFYAGAQFSHETVRTRTEGARGGSGIDSGDFGDFGTGAGLFAGFGLTYGRWYGGIELQGEGSDSGWFHQKIKTGSRTSSVDKNDSYGAALRGGYVLGNGSLLYAEAGKVRTDFDTHYEVNGDPATVVQRTFTEDGTRVGLGVETPAGRHLFWRMEYTHTDYDSYTVDYGIDTEQFDNDDNQFKLGLGWRFGAAGRAPAPLQVDFDGFYVGAQAGHGEVSSQVDAQHYDSGAGPFPFTADFADAGPDAGLFAGWGTTINKWYLGVEVEADSSRARWHHIRETGSPGGGRDFSVSKKGSHGFAGRIGYVLNGGSMLYARAGIVNTKFNTQYKKGNNAAAWVDRDDELDGTRLGLGAEIPTSNDVFLRFDYTVTDYDNYGFATTHGSNPDTAQFDNKESLFRFGIAVRF